MLRLAGVFRCGGGPGVVAATGSAVLGRWRVVIGISRGRAEETTKLEQQPRLPYLGGGGSHGQRDARGAKRVWGGQA